MLLAIVTTSMLKFSMTKAIMTTLVDNVKYRSCKKNANIFLTTR